MKVSIDAILGSAQKINNQRQIGEETPDRRKKEIKTDSFSLSSRVDSRLDGIDREFREIQSSLTRNQIIRDGIDQLKNDYGRGGQNAQDIMNGVTFEGNRVLRSFVGEAVTEDILNSRSVRINEMISGDVDRLKRLQVELDNIMASNLAGPDKVGNIMSNVDRAFAEAGAAGIENISHLRPDAVMRLIK
jgi:hypothetical protein